MSPSVLRRSGPDIDRNGLPTTPRALVSTCEVCGEPAPFGDTSTGKLLTWCPQHKPIHFTAQTSRETV